MAYIFTPGQCKKSELYDMLLNAMIAAGWQNITSNYATDGDVMYSTGINGDKTLYINLLPYCGTATVVSAANDAAQSTRTTVYANWGYRLQQSYIPGASGTAGTFARPSRTFQNFYLHTTSQETYWINPGTYGAYLYSYTFPADTLMNYYIYVDKSKVILFVKAPDTISKNWVCLYIGLPDTLYAKCGDGRGVVAATAFRYSGNVVNAGAFDMTEYPDANQGQATTGANTYPVTILGILSTVSPNMNSKYFTTELFYQNATYGIIGKLDGIMGVPLNGLNSGDTITVPDGTVYTVLRLVCPPYVNYGSTYYFSSSFLVQALAIRLA